MIIGITGTNGAGKGTVVDYLVKQKGFVHFSVRQFLYEEIDRRGMPRDRNSTNFVGNDLRKQFGAGYIAEQLFDQAKIQGGNVIIESIRAVGEADYLKQHGAFLWAVDANRHVRYERAVLRGSHLDKVSFEEFCAQEDREMASDDPTKHNVQKIIDIADTVLINNGTPEELYAQVEAALHKSTKSIDKIAWICNKDRRTLYVRSKSKELFFNPGGKREGNETDQQALIREIKEELCVDLIPESISYLETFKAQAAGKSEGVMVEIKCYEADFVGTLAPASEIEELAWFTSADMERTSATGQLILKWLKEKNLID